MTRKFGIIFASLCVIAAPWGCGSGGERSGNPDASGGERPEEASTQPAARLELEARYPEGFGFLSGVRELSNGSVLAADPLSQLLLRIDMDAGTADTLGRVGPGPQEYRQPDRVLPLPGDSSLLVDLGKMQLTLLTPEGRLGPGLPMNLPSGNAFPIVLQPRFVDRAGRLYDQAGRSRGYGPPDSAAVVRFDRGTRALDTVAFVWLPAFRQTRSRTGEVLPRLLEPMDAWAIGPDGRIAIVRAKDFSVEWILPDGQRLRGPAHSFPGYPVGREDKEAIFTEMRNSGIAMTAATSPDGSVHRMTMGRGLPSSGDAPGIDDFEWAEVLPPFQPEGAIVSPEGDLWVQRWLPAGSESRWECFDAGGSWLGSVVLPPGHTLIGFGRGPEVHPVAYLTYTDEFDLKWLERYRVVR